jgi:hypothetical protein
MKEIELKYEHLYCLLDLDFKGYRALITLRDKEIEEWKRKNY